MTEIILLNYESMGSWSMNFTDSFKIFVQTLPQFFKIPINSLLCCNFFVPNAPLVMFYYVNSKKWEMKFTSDFIKLSLITSQCIFWEWLIFLTFHCSYFIWVTWWQYQKVRISIVQQYMYWKEQKKYQTVNGKHL